MKNPLCYLLLIVATSCASITGSSSDKLRVVASPPGASVHVNGEERGAAPLTVDVPKKRGVQVTVHAPGHRTTTCNTTMSAGGGYIAADIALCLIFFPIGCISFIDAGGAWNQLDSPYCEVSLAPQS